MTAFLSWVEGIPDILVYLALAAGAAVENIVPAVPADTFVAAGGFLAGAGTLDWRWVALATWLANTGGALGVYKLSRRLGPAFFETNWGHFLLRPHQMERMRRFYARWGLPAIFLSRFLPGVRAVVPIFAGALRQPGRMVLPPIAIASAIWYGGLVLLGMWAGQNLELLARLLDRIGLSVGIAAAVVAASAFLWWVVTRGEPDE